MLNEFWVGFCLGVNIGIIEMALINLAVIMLRRKR